MHLPVKDQSYLPSRERIKQCRIDTPTALAFGSPPFRFRFRRQTQDRVPPYLPDDAHLLSEQGQNQTLAHKPGIDQPACVLGVPPDGIGQLARHPEFARWPDSSTNQERIGAVKADLSRTWTTSAKLLPSTGMAVQEGGPIVAFRAWPCLILMPDPLFAVRGTSVSSIIRFNSSAGNTLCTSCGRQLDTLATDTCNPLNQFVIGGPVRLVATRPDGTADPAFRVEHTPDQEFHEGPPETRWHRHQEKGNPFREQQTNRGSERHERASEKENSSLVAALLAVKSTPSEQRGDLRNRTSCQVVFHFFEYVFRAVGIPSTSDSVRRYLKFRLLKERGTYVPLANRMDLSIPSSVSPLV